MTEDRRQMVKLENEVSLAEDDLTILVIQIYLT
jgi:hypothetical protein